MKSLFFYDTPILPSEFRFPESYLKLAQGSVIPDLEPWHFMFLDMPSSLQYYGAMLQKYHDKTLIPFAISNDPSGLFNDGYVLLACFDGDEKTGNPKVYFHDYSNPKVIDWIDRYSLANFEEWLRVAQQESAQFKADRNDKRN